MNVVHICMDLYGCMLVCIILIYRNVWRFSFLVDYLIDWASIRGLGGLPVRLGVVSW